MRVLQGLHQSGILRGIFLLHLLQGCSDAGVDLIQSLGQGLIACSIILLGLFKLQAAVCFHFRD